MKKLAVTAASGQLGAAIVGALLKEVSAEQIVAIARTPTKAAGLGVAVRRGDYTDKASFDEALEGIDTLLIVSGNGNPADRIPMHRNIIEAAKDQGVRKVVYTSISGKFGPIVESNLQTEEDIRNSGLAWSIGRNGIYIEPDVEYIEQYRKDGKIANCAGEGKCSYTTREELAYAYTQMMLDDKHNGQTYYLAGEALTQAQVAEYLNSAFGTSLVYESMTVAEYKADRVAELGPFMGGVIAAIYGSIRNGDSEVVSDFEQAAGRPHIAWADYFAGLKA